MPATARRMLLARPAVALIVAIAVFALTAPALALANTVTAQDGTLGKFTFGKELSGSVTTPGKWNLGYGQTITGCEKTVDPGEFNIVFFNLKLKLNGKTTVMTGGDSTLPAFMGIDVQKYGNTESVVYSATTSAPSAVGITLFQGHNTYTWLTNAYSPTVKSSGTITTNAKGTAGSLDATLVPAGTGETSGRLTTKANGLLTIKGSWTSCAAKAKTP